MCVIAFVFFFFKQKTAYELRISDWSSDVCSSDLTGRPHERALCRLPGEDPRRPRDRRRRLRTRGSRGTDPMTGTPTRSIAIFDYRIVPTNPVGGCHRRLLERLAADHDFTVFAVDFDAPGSGRVTFRSVPGLRWGE